MSDDFFGKLDAKLASQSAAKEQKLQEKANIAEFNKSAIQEARPIFEEYVQKLKERDLTVELKGGEQYLSMELKHSDGNGRTLTLGPNFGDPRLEFVEYFQDKGKQYSSRSGERYSAGNWNEVVMRERIERFIETHLLFADRNGGLI